ncbi:MAG: hypothetical protein IH594_14810 [Bacteroidales bacterium]|nr:hypothetical protein [Bacteroidales bacterium]
MQKIISISTGSHNGLYEITSKLAEKVRETNVQYEMVNVYVQGPTAGVMIHFTFMSPAFRFLRYNFRIL